MGNGEITQSDISVFPMEQWENKDQQFLEKLLRPLSGKDSKKAMMSEDLKALIDQLERDRILPKKDLEKLIDGLSVDLLIYAAKKAWKLEQETYGRKVYMRGLIELSNYCKKDCYYCGIRRSNNNAQRYRLKKEDVLSCCEEGYQLGFRTFVLQGGEDPYYTVEKMVDILSAISNSYKDCAITLSLGEKSKEEYEAYYQAGARRYLLRHETATKEHYAQLHPPELTLKDRQRCLKDLGSLGFQVGCGFMVGSPGQHSQHLAEDLIYIHDLQPHMVGLGPFIPHKDTPFGKESPGGLLETLFMLSLVRLILPKVLLPATTALGTIEEMGREMGVLCGANVVMPNLSPGDVRIKYLLYDDKICTGDEAAQSCRHLGERMAKIGFLLSGERGDHWDKAQEI